MGLPERASAEMRWSKHAEARWDQFGRTCPALKSAGLTTLRESLVNEARGIAGIRTRKRNRQ
ncbi:MAG: hypothetical protein DMF71_04330 [Acidobacteria bacterium]|nr:MAG: hypothetical protein DMF71_04330 [Acidobacteriota bacterium]